MEGKHNWQLHSSAHERPRTRSSSCVLSHWVVVEQCLDNDFARTLLWEEDPHSFTLALAFSLSLSLLDSRLDDLCNYSNLADILTQVKLRNSCNYLICLLQQLDSVGRCCSLLNGFVCVEAKVLLHALCQFSSSPKSNFVVARPTLNSCAKQEVEGKLFIETVTG